MKAEKELCDRDFFNQLMANLSLTYRQMIEKKTVDEYWRHLKIYPKEKLVIVFKDIVEIEEFFPTIAAFIKQLRVTRLSEEPEPWPDFKKLRQDATKQIAKDSLKVIFQQLTDPMLIEDYCQELMELDKKYPKVGFKEAAEKLRRRKGGSYVSASMS